MTQPPGYPPPWQAPPQTSPRSSWDGSGITMWLKTQFDHLEYVMDRQTEVALGAAEDVRELTSEVRTWRQEQAASQRSIAGPPATPPPTSSVLQQLTDLLKAMVPVLHMVLAISLVVVTVVYKATFPEVLPLLRQLLKLGAG